MAVAAVTLLRLMIQERLGVLGGHPIDPSCTVSTLHLPWMTIIRREGMAMCTYNYICSIPYLFLHTYTHTYIHACMHAYMHTCIRTYIRTYIHACIHTYIHASGVQQTASFDYMHVHWIHIHTHILAVGMY